MHTLCCVSFIIIFSWYQSPIPSLTLTGLVALGTEGVRHRLTAELVQTPNVQMGLPLGITGIKR
jgi:hypothetical protein